MFTTIFAPATRILFALSITHVVDFMLVIIGLTIKKIWLEIWRVDLLYQLVIVCLF